MHACTGAGGVGGVGEDTGNWGLKSDREEYRKLGLEE